MSESEVAPRVPVAGTAAVAVVLAGATLVCAGTALPWMSFFAGLQSISGLVGLYGRTLFGSGVLAALLGAAMLRRSHRWLQPTIAALGAAQTLFIIWLLLGLRATIRELGVHAMLLARPGPGLFVALAGAVLLCSGLTSLGAAARVWLSPRGSAASLGRSRLPRVRRRRALP